MARRGVEATLRGQRGDGPTDQLRERLRVAISSRRSWNRAETEAAIALSRRRDVGVWPVGNRTRRRWAHRDDVTPTRIPRHAMCAQPHRRAGERGDMRAPCGRVVARDSCCSNTGAATGAQQVPVHGGGASESRSSARCELGISPIAAMNAASCLVSVPIVRARRVVVRDEVTARAASPSVGLPHRRGKSSAPAAAAS